MKRLIVAPHADDETFGCGGLIAKYPGDCAVVICAQPTPSRLEEFELAMNLLSAAGEKRLTWLLGLQENHVGDNPSELVRKLDDVLAEYKPDELYLPYPGVHQDHRAAYEGGMRAARLSMDVDHWYPPAVFVYDVPVYELDLYPVGLRFNVFEALLGRHVDAKAMALAAYVSESVPGPHPGNGVREKAMTVGAEHGVMYAEQYALVRWTRR